MNSTNLSHQFLENSKPLKDLDMLHNIFFYFLIFTFALMCITSFAAVIYILIQKKLNKL